MGLIGKIVMQSLKGTGRKILWSFQSQVEDGRQELLRSFYMLAVASLSLSSTNGNYNRSHFSAHRKRLRPSTGFMALEINAL